MDSAVRDGRSGIEVMRQMLSGQVAAPVCALVGFRLVSVAEGAVQFELEPSEAQYNLMGTVHGGVVATLLDSSMGCAVHSRLAAGETYGTVEINVNYVRPVTAQTGPLLCEGRVVTMSSRVATARAELVDREGRVYAHGSSVCVLIR